MAEVPYKPVPTAEAHMIPTPNVRVETPIAAFGGDVANALQGLGQQVQHAGDELFQRAVAIQNLRNEAEAKEADAKYVIESSRLHAEYNSLQGRAAADAFPAYMENLKRLRTDIRATLASDQARKLYDGPSLSFMSRTVFNGAGHAAVETKRSIVAASNARIDALKSQALLTPHDDLQFKTSVNATIAEVQGQQEIFGWGPDELNNQVQKKVSALWAERIDGFTKSNPFVAEKLFNEAVRDGKLRGEDIPKAENKVRQATLTVGSRQIANGIITGNDITIGSVAVPIERAKLAIAGKESGGNYLAQGPWIDRGGGRQDRAYGKYQVMGDNIGPWTQQVLGKAMTPEEFLANPEAQEKVFEEIFGGYMKQYGSFNQAASMWFTGKPLEALKGGEKDILGTTVPVYLRDTNAILAKTAGLRELVDTGKKVAETLAPNQPLLGDYVEQRIVTTDNREKAIKRDADLTNINVINAAIMGGPDGKLPSTIEELTADPAVKLAWDNLEPTKQRAFLSALTKNARGDVVWDDKRLKRWEQLVGMSNVDPKAFVETDILAEDIPRSAKRELVKLQQARIKTAQGDPRVQHAVTMLRPMLTAAGLTYVRDPERYQQFVGALQDQINQFQEREKRPPKNEDIQLIGARLLQEQAVPGTFFGSYWPNKTPTFELKVPSEEAEKIKNDPSWAAKGVVPTDAMIQRIWAAAQYKKLYGGTVKKPEGGPAAPKQ